MLFIALYFVTFNGVFVDGATEYDGWRGKSFLDDKDMIEIGTWVTQLNAPNETIDETLKYYWVNNEIMYPYAAIIRGMYAVFNESTKSSNFTKSFLYGLEIIVHYTLLKSFPVIGRKGGIRGQGTDKTILKAAIPSLITCYKKFAADKNFTVTVFPIMRRRKRRVRLFPHPKRHDGKSLPGRSKQRRDIDDIDSEDERANKNEDSTEHKSATEHESANEHNIASEHESAIEHESSNEHNSATEHESATELESAIGTESTFSNFSKVIKNNNETLLDREVDDNNALALNTENSNNTIKGRYTYTLSYGTQLKSKKTSIVVAENMSGKLENVGISICWLIYELIPVLCGWNQADAKPFKDAFDLIVGLVLSMYLYDTADFSEEYERIFKLSTKEYEAEWNKIEFLAKKVQRDKKLLFTNAYSDIL